MYKIVMIAALCCIQVSANAMPYGKDSKREHTIPEKISENLVNDYIKVRKNIAISGRINPQGKKDLSLHNFDIAVDITPSWLTSIDKRTQLNDMEYISVPYEKNQSREVFYESLERAIHFNKRKNILIYSQNIKQSATVWKQYTHYLGDKPIVLSHYLPVK